MSLIEHLEKLRHFYKVTNYRSINEGAQAMGLSQAGLSKSIANLESVLETKLFVRSSDGLRMTNEGQLVLEATKKIVALTADLESNLRSMRAIDIPEKVTVGMYDSIAVYFFEDLRSYLKVIYPQVELELVVNTSSNLSLMTQSGDLDLAIGVGFNTQPISKTEFFLLFEDHFSFYQSAKMDLKDSTERSLIYHPDASDQNGVKISKHISALTKSRLSHRVYNFETIKMLTSNGVGIGVLPTQVARPLVQANNLVSVKLPRTPNLFGKHSIGFLASSRFLKSHRAFAQDIFRLGDRWSKT
jgi:DNA-binding transcriptional LysR family regulator